MKIFSAETIKEIDQQTITHESIDSIDLMERAAEAVVSELIGRFGRDRHFVVFAGQGNNGGDALAVARILIENGYRVETFLFNPYNKLSDECEFNKQRMLELSQASFVEVISTFDPPPLNERSVVIDGLFGIGLSRPLSGGYISLVDYINESDAMVVSIDIPSGLFCEDNRENNPRHIIRADLTLTFQFPKLAFLMADNAPYIGEWKILDIGLSPRAIYEAKSNVRYLEKEEVGMLLRARQRVSHKGDYGHALIVAGSMGMMGACILAVKACLRSGAGLVSTHIPQCGYPILQTAVPEAMVHTDFSETHITDVGGVIEYDALGIGPGIGREFETVQALKRMLSQLKRPCVLDADALNIIAEHRDCLHSIPPGSILTPHPREMMRLVGECDSSIDLMIKSIDLAKQLNIVVLLKGAYSVVISPSGRCSFNSTGNAGMASGGSGDVLTGMITALLAQGYTSEDAAIIGMYTHGLAGNLALSNESHESLIASDIVAYIGRAFNTIRNEQYNQLSKQMRRG